MIDYGRVLREGWRATRRCGGVWILVGGYTLVALVVWAGAGSLAAAAFGWDLSSALEGRLDPALLVGAGALAAIGGLVSLVAFLVAHGGSVFLTGEFQEGRPAGVLAGLGAGFRLLPRVFALDLMVALVGVATVLVPTGVFFGAVLALASSDQAQGLAFLGVCCGEFLMIALIFVAASVLVAVESLGVRSAVIDRRGPLQAFGDAWRFLKDRFKSVFVMMLVFLGLQLAFQFVLQIVTSPISLLFTGNTFAEFGRFADTTRPVDPAAVLGPMLGLVVANSVVTLVLTVPWSVFWYGAWTAFYRQLTGRDVPAPPAASAYATAEGAPWPSPPEAPAAATGVLPAPPQQSPTLPPPPGAWAPPAGPASRPLNEPTAAPEPPSDG